MRAAANFAFANRQVLVALDPRGLRAECSASRRRDLGLRVVYDVAHNIAKEEEHEVDGAGDGSSSTARARRAPFPVSPCSCPATWGGIRTC